MGARVVIATGSPYQNSRARTMPDFKTLFRWFCLTACVFFITFTYATTPWFTDFQNMLAEFCEDQSTLSMMLVGICYTLLLAIPFVPAVELGILIMIVFGKTGCLFAYVCTLAGLSLSYFIGWFICRFHLNQKQSCSKGNRQIQQLMEKLSQTRSGAILQRCSPEIFFKYRYLAIAILVNFPGNMVIGGGGGIAMFCGAFRPIQFTKFAFTMAIAISPLPILILAGIKLVS